MNEKITFPIIDTEARKISDAREGIIELTEQYLVIFIKFKSYEAKDDDIHIREEVVYHTYSTVCKEKVDRIRIFFDALGKKFCVQVDDSAPIYFETWSEGKAIVDKIVSWRYSKTAVKDEV